MVSPKVDFLYLDEEDMIEADVMNMHEAVNEMEVVMSLLSKGDYVMGGKDGNSHGIMLAFPDEPEHEGMPKNGPDRRFVAMPAYLGGPYQTTGVKWYGSNVENVPKELPRSILMMTLNDKDTGAPYAHMSANLLSAWRTGAIPGVGVRYLAKPDSKVFGSLGAGSIGTSSAEGILAAAENIELVKIYDNDKSTAETLKERLENAYPDIEVKIVDTIEEAVRDSDIVNTATSGVENPRIEKEWMKPGSLITASSSADLDPEDTINNHRLIADHWAMYEETLNEDYYPYNKLELGILGRLFLDWREEGKMSEDIITDVGDVINGKAPARESEDEVVIFALGGMPVYDVAWGYRIYQNALEKGIGTKLNLWDRAYQAR